MKNYYQKTRTKGLVLVDKNKRAKIGSRGKRKPNPNLKNKETITKK